MNVRTCAQGWRVLDCGGAASTAAPTAATTVPKTRATRLCSRTPHTIKSITRHLHAGNTRPFTAYLGFAFQGSREKGGGIANNRSAAASSRVPTHPFTDTLS